MLVWQGYQTDVGRVYPMYALSITQTNDVDTSVNPLDLLPPAVSSQLLRVRNPCSVPQLIPRILSLWLSDGANFTLTYPVPFSESLAQSLTANTSVQAWEFIGERIRYGRLQRMLDNV